MTDTLYTIVGSSNIFSATVTGPLTLSDLPGASATNLTTLIIGTDVTRIGGEAFYNCTRLTSINIPYGITTIGRSAFAYCSSLESVTIPDSVTSIEYQSFIVCSSLASVTFGGPLTNANIESEIFNYIGPNATREFRFNTYDSTLINQSLLDQIKLTTQHDTVSSAGPQIFILPPPPTNISNGTELLAFLTTDAEYGNINNSIVVTPDLINTSTSNILKILVNITPNLITIVKS